MGFEAVRGNKPVIPDMADLARETRESRSGVQVCGRQEVETEAQDEQNGSNCHEFHVLMFYHFSSPMMGSAESQANTWSRHLARAGAGQTTMKHKCFTPKNENPPYPPFQRGVLKIPLWQRGI
jgi:hypothetical protein